MTAPNRHRRALFLAEAPKAHSTFAAEDKYGAPPEQRPINLRVLLPTASIIPNAGFGFTLVKLEVAHPYWYARRLARPETRPTRDSRCSTAHGSGSRGARLSPDHGELARPFQAAWIEWPAFRQHPDEWHRAQMVGFVPTTLPPLRSG